MPLSQPKVAALLQLLICEMDEPIAVVLDTDGYFLSWHPAVELVFGYTESEFVGQPVDLLFPEPERTSGEGRRELEVAARNGRASDTRWLATKTGHTRFVEGATLPLLDKAGNMLGFGKIMRDITESRNSEDSLAALARALDQSIVIVRQWNGVIDHWTAGCERLYGWTAVEAVGKSVQEVLRTQYPAHMDVIQEQLLRCGTWKGEIEHVRRDGSHVFVSTYWVLLSDDEDDEPRTVIETHTDITARLVVQQQLESANTRLQSMAAELERSNQELEEFARIASHDLSAPITSTRWLVDLLAARHGASLDESANTMLKQITQGLERMSDLVDAVLAHARMGTSAIGSAEPVSAQDALAIALNNLQHDIEVSGANVQAGPLPHLNIDKHALSQLFQNLLSNAIKYARPGVRPEIRITARWKKPKWEFSVQDNGVGIEREWYQRIFQPMQRLHGLDVPGSGIGLATCKKIVDRAGGEISVRSQLGAGSTFYFTAPGPKPG